MLYSILCYESEALAAGRTKREDDAMIGRLRGVLQKLKAEGKLGPVARLMPTTTATHIRSGKESSAVFDGPFAETKEQLGGYYLIEASDLDQAISIAARIPGARHGSIEVRPIMPRTQAVQA
jgi:hypothetical protein